MASFWLQACSLVRLFSVDSVFPMYFSVQPGQLYSYMTKDLLMREILSLFDEKKFNFVDLKNVFILTFSFKNRDNFFLDLCTICSDCFPMYGSDRMRDFGCSSVSSTSR